MLKSLLWKEWRENWVILLMAIGVICLLAYLLEINREFNLGINDVKYVFLFIPLFIAIITANLFSTEFGHNTMPFLLTQPISRSKLWLTKVGFGIFIVLLLILGSVLGVYLVSHLTPHLIQFNELIDITAFGDFNAILAVCLLFASGIFMASMVSNTYVAAFGSLLFAGLIAIVWAFTGEMFYLYERWYGSFWILIAFLMVSSYYVFTRPEILLTKKRIKHGLGFLAILCFIYFSIATLIQSNYDDGLFKYQPISKIYSEKPIPTRNLVVATVYKGPKLDYLQSSRLCVISIDSAPKYTYLPRGYNYDGTASISPDSRYIIIKNSRRLFGLLQCRLFTAKPYLLDLNTFKISRLHLKGEKMLHQVTNIYWSSDGNKLYYIVISPLEREYIYRMFDFNTREDKVHNSELDLAGYYANKDIWAKDGKSFYLRASINLGKESEKVINQLKQMSINRKVLWQITQYGTVTRPIISPDKNWLLYSSDTSDPSKSRKGYLKNLTTGESTYILSSPNIKFGLWSPDSKWIAISTISAKSECAVWLVDLTTKGKRLVDSEPAYEVNFWDWLNDSRKIYFRLKPIAKRVFPGRV
jgi:ABC-type transport system involved in multi-copper enzyme maturation permease subunit